MEKLIPGGIYTFSNINNIYYVFLKTHDNNLYVFTEECDLSTNIQSYINSKIELSNKNPLFFNIRHIEIEKFLELCDGFVGNIQPKHLDLLLKVLEEKIPFFKMGGVY